MAFRRYVNDSLLSEHATVLSSSLRRRMPALDHVSCSSYLIRTYRHGGQQAKSYATWTPRRTPTTHDISPGGDTTTYSSKSLQARTTYSSPKSEAIPHRFFVGARAIGRIS